MFTCCKNDSSVINLIYTGQLQFSHKYDKLPFGNIEFVERENV